MVRYDTPEIFGFIGTVNFGEDDTWEVGLRYKNDKFHGFKLAAAIAYGENTEGPLDAYNADPVPGFQCLGNNLDGPALDRPVARIRSARSSVDPSASCTLSRASTATSPPAT